MTTPLVQTIDLKKYFDTPRGKLHAVDNINLSINQGETLGVVGESGCGKSTLGRVILKLIPKTSGQVMFEGKNIFDYNKKENKLVRTNMQIIFQDPYASLDPRKSVEELIKEPIIINNLSSSRKNATDRVLALMEKVGLAKRLANSYPHELDGGRRQRIGIARALAANPKFIVCDEPVSALDVSIQAQILNLLMDLQKDMGLTYMFITHDLSVVRHISNNIMVMYLGQCIEKGPVEEIFNNPLHPYTQALLRAIPKPEVKSRHEKPQLIKGEVSNPIEPKPGCRFANRCPFNSPACTGEEIVLREMQNSHYVACRLLEE